MYTSWEETAIRWVRVWYPIGTRLRLENDYPNDSHEICQYINEAGKAFMQFKDGSRLDLVDIDQILEVCEDQTNIEGGADKNGISTGKNGTYQGI